MNAFRWILKGVVIVLGCTALWACQTKPPASEESVSTTEARLSEEQKPIEGSKTILFFGNSLTAGYEVDPEDNFVSLVQGFLDSLQLDYRTINAGVSGETTSSGLSRIDWILQQQVDVFILELGGNDGLRGIPTQETRNNLQAMIDKVKAAKPEAAIILAGMQVPPNMGPDYADSFERIFPELAESNNIGLIPFLLENVGGEPELNLPDGIHPNEDGHQIVAKNVWEVLKNYVQ